jgi:hypothetical protein
MALRTNAKGKTMRKLVVAFSAVAMVALGTSIAQAQATQKCPSPETLKFEQPFQVGQSQGGITITAANGDTSVTFSIGDQVTVTDICVKAGTTAPVFSNFSGTGASIGGISLSYNCAITNGNLVGPCTVTVTRTSGPGISHVTFYTTAYVAPEVAGEVVAAGGVGVGVAAGGGSAPSSGVLAFTGAQISIMLAVLAGLIIAGTLAWTAGRRRAAKTD